MDRLFCIESVAVGVRNFCLAAASVSWKDTVAAVAMRIVETSGSMRRISSSFF